jgi:uncharacterized protein (TIGR02284 family)
MATATMNNSAAAATLNSLLRGEISAVETYDQAISKFEGDATAAALGRIRDEHVSAVTTLREHVRMNGGEPSEGSGAWGTFATAVTGAAKVVGPGTVLAALRQGEEHGINEYESALKGKDLQAPCCDVIRTQLLPKCRQHVAELDRLVGGLDDKSK